MIIALSILAFSLVCVVSFLLRDKDATTVCYYGYMINFMLAMLSIRVIEKQEMHAKLWENILAKNEEECDTIRVIEKQEMHAQLRKNIVTKNEEECDSKGGMKILESKFERAWKEVNLLRQFSKYK